MTLHTLDFHSCKKYSVCLSSASIHMPILVAELAVSFRKTSHSDHQTSFPLISTFGGERNLYVKSCSIININSCYRNMFIPFQSC
jgi:hypothetical protein